MQFFQTNTHFLKENLDEVRQIEKYCPHELSGSDIVTINGLLTDDEMLKNGRPYYQIYPDVFEAVSDTTLDLDVDDWKVPFDCFEIRMPKTERPLIPVQPNSPYGVMSIQVFRNFYKRLVIISQDGIWCTYQHIRYAHPESLQQYVAELSNQTAIKVNICDFENPQNEYEHQYLMTTLRYASDTRIRDVVDTTIRRILAKESFYSGGSDLKDMSGEAWSTTLKLALGVSLLATGSQKILEYDVLSKHLEAYRKMRDKGDVSECKRIEDIAKKKGKYGWNIGKPRERHLPLSEGSYDGGTGNRDHHHHFCSYRCGHWHKYHTGTHRTKVKMVWLNPTVVRPDLPNREQIA